MFVRNSFNKNIDIVSTAYCKQVYILPISNNIPFLNQYSVWICDMKFHGKPVGTFVGISHPDGEKNDTSLLSIRFMKWMQISSQLQDHPVQFTAGMIDRWHFYQTVDRGFGLAVIRVDVLSMFVHTLRRSTTQ
jgi:hypothetical protein